MGTFPLECWDGNMNAHTFNIFKGFDGDFCIRLSFTPSALDPSLFFSRETALKLVKFIIDNQSPAPAAEKVGIPTPAGPGSAKAAPGMEAALEELAEARKSCFPLPRGTVAAIAVRHGVQKNLLYQAEFKAKGGKTHCWLCAHYVRIDPNHGTCELKKTGVTAGNNSDGSCPDFGRNIRIALKHLPPQPAKQEATAG